MFCFWKEQVFQFCLLSVWDLLGLIPCVFWFEIFTIHSPYWVYWVVTEIWAWNSFHKTCNVFLFIIASTERKICFFVELFHHFLTEYSSLWAEIFCVLSQILLGFFHKISTRNYFWKMFHKLLALQGATLSWFAKFFHSFCNFVLSSHCGKKFRKYLHTYFHMSFVFSQGGTSKKKTQKKI